MCRAGSGTAFLLLYACAGAACIMGGLTDHGMTSGQHSNLCTVCNQVFPGSIDRYGCQPHCLRPLSQTDGLTSTRSHDNRHLA